MDCEEPAHTFRSESDAEVTDEHCDALKMLG